MKKKIAISKKIKNITAWFLTACLLAGQMTGCGQNVDESAYNQKAAEIQSEEISERTDDSTMSEPQNEDFVGAGNVSNTTGTLEQILSGLDLSQYDVWDGTGILNKNTAEQLDKMQYYHGKTYVIDEDDRVLGEPLPAVARQTEDGYVEPDISYFYFTENELFYLEESKTVRSPYLDTRCFDLYVQSLKTGQVKLLAENVEEAVYDSGVIIYEEFLGTGEEREEKNVIVQRISAEYGEILDESNLGNLVQILDYNKDYLICYSAIEDIFFYYYWDSKERKEILIPNTVYFYNKCFVYGSVFGYIIEKDGTRKMVELYEQGRQVFRLFPQELPENYWFTDEKIYYAEGRKVQMYDLATGKEQFICELGANEYGENRFCTAEESGGIILLEEISDGPAGGYPIVYLYEVRDGEKTLVTDDFWME